MCLKQNPERDKVQRSGKCTITAYYGEGNLAAKYTCKITSTIPIFKKNVVTVKKGSTTTVTIEKVSKDLVPAWSVKGYNTELEIPEGFAKGCFLWETMPRGKSKTVHKMKITGKTPGTDVLVATIDDVEYYCFITVTE